MEIVKTQISNLCVRERKTMKQFTTTLLKGRAIDTAALSISTKEGSALMRNKTIIAWTDHTFNPWMGCSKVSAGCAHCYAETQSIRYGRHIWGNTAERVRTSTTWGKVYECQRDAARGIPGVLGLNRPHLVFTGSLMDWAEDRSDLISIRDEMWEIIRSCPNLHFQLLTKRPENILKMLPDDWGNGYPNVWLGTSIEDMRVQERADYLRKVPALVRFISYEPALGSLDDLDIAGIDWVIYGGESGPGYRPEDKDWAREMRAKCRKTGAAFFHKQSAAPRTEMGIELDGEIVREFPIHKLR